jgi:hypothetical protein
MKGHMLLELEVTGCERKLMCFLTRVVDIQYFWRHLMEQDENDGRSNSCGREMEGLKRRQYFEI